jgi:acetyl-CoA C-acetyltransferase
VAELCAVIGIGQTKYDAKRIDVSMPGLVREAATRALQDADLSWKDIDALVIGKAPDMFEGVMMPELFLAEALGGAGKPMIRVHTAGSVGGTTGIVAAGESGVFGACSASPSRSSPVQRRGRHADTVQRPLVAGRAAAHR